MDIKVSASLGKVYVPKALREVLGMPSDEDENCKMSLRAIANERAVMLFPEGADLDVLIKSVKHIERELKHKKEVEEIEAQNHLNSRVEGHRNNALETVGGD